MLGITCLILATFIGIAIGYIWKSGRWIMSKINICPNKSNVYCMGTQQYCDGKSCGNYIEINKKYKDRFNEIVGRCRKTALNKIIKKIGNDSKAVQFQTLGQYRSWLIKKVQQMKEEK